MVLMGAEDDFEGNAFIEHCAANPRTGVPIFMWFHPATAEASCGPAGESAA